MNFLVRPDAEQLLTEDDYRRLWDFFLGMGAGAAGIELPRDMLTIDVPTLVLWGLGDTALRPELLDGLDDYVPRLTVERLPTATHWLLHEQPRQVMAALERFLAQ